MQKIFQPDNLIIFVRIGSKLFYDKIPIHPIRDISVYA